MADVQLEARICGGHMVVALRGHHLSAVEAAEIAAVLGVVAGRGRSVIVDLSCLEFTDRSALHALARARDTARQADGDVLLAAPAGAVARLLLLTCLGEALGVHVSVAAAAASATRADASAGLVRSPT
jgi:anti-anti-sigma factor